MRKYPFRLACVSLLTLIGTLMFAGAIAHAGNNVRLTVKDGKLYKDGKEYRGFGLNAAFLSDRVIRAGKDAKEAFETIEYLGKKKIPYVRTWLGCMENWKPYFNNEQKYWENMDLIVDAFEKANVGLIPTLFWKQEMVPWEFNETQKDMLNPDSNGRKFMAEYTRKLVNRYKDRKIIWMWEWSNETNYFWDLPHERLLKNRDNAFTYKIGVEISKAFADEVVKIDSSRPISTGNGGVRPDAYNRALNPGNTSKRDTQAEQDIVASWSCPDPYSIFSIHSYSHIRNGACNIEPLRGNIRRHMQMAEKLSKPLFLGEFGLLERSAAEVNLETDDISCSMEDYKEATRKIFQILYEEKVPLAAWWAYTDNDTFFYAGIINREKYRKFEWIIDLINEYNEKLERELQ